jgi:hypothetical protein
MLFAARHLRRASNSDLASGPESIVPIILNHRFPRGQLLLQFRHEIRKDGLPARNQFSRNRLAPGRRLPIGASTSRHKASCTAGTC